MMFLVKIASASTHIMYETRSLLLSVRLTTPCKLHFVHVGCVLAMAGPWTPAFMQYHVWTSELGAPSRVDCAIGEPLSGCRSVWRLLVCQTAL